MNEEEREDLENVVDHYVHTDYTRFTDVILTLDKHMSKGNEDLSEESFRADMEMLKANFGDTQSFARMATITMIGMMRNSMPTQAVIKALCNECNKLRNQLAEKQIEVALNINNMGGELN